MLVVAAVPQWVNDWGVYIGFLVGVFTLIAFTYGFTKFAVTLTTRIVDNMFAEKVPPLIATALEPVNEKLTHLHDCIERVGLDATVNAKEAASQATEARVAVQDHAEVMREHILNDEVSFGAAKAANEETRAWRNNELKNWQDTVDISLSNIQNAQAPHTT